MDKANPDKLFNLLELCCQRVAEKFGTKAIKDWTNSDYLHLSAALLRQTQVSISPNTLKRIFGKLKTPDRYYPQKATRDALAQYAGFRDWPDLEAQNQQEVSTEVTIPEIQQTETSRKRVGTRKEKVDMLLLMGVAVVIAAFFFILHRYYSNPPQLLTAQLICKNPEGETPHSAIFELQLPPGFKGISDEFSIDFGDGEARRPLSAGQQLSHYYEIPGRYYASLSYKDKVTDTAVVYLKTEGWTATAREPQDTTRVYPLYKEDIQTDHSLFVNTGQLYRAGIDTNHTFFVDFVNTRPFNISADNFELSTNLKTSADRAGVRCSPLYLYIYGEKTFHYFNIHKPGCEAWIQARFSEWAREGSSPDIKAFTADLSKGGQITLRIKNKKVTLYINGKDVIDLSYKIPVGTIYGIAISFAGIGEIYNAAIKDLNKDSTEQLFPLPK